MNTVDKNRLNETLNICTQLLTEDVTVDRHEAVIVIDRSRYNLLLREVARAKQLLARPPVSFVR